MGDQHFGDVDADGDVVSALLLGLHSAITTLSGAVVDEVENPLWMLANDGGPEELLIRASTTIPLVWEAR